MSQLNISLGKRGRGVASTSSAAVSASSSSTDLASLFECPVCFEYVLPPILQCQSGHLVCSNCRPKLSLCPTCRGPLGNIRNLAMEKVASNVMFPCKYSTSGCTVTMVHIDKPDHEDTCEFRPYSCPCPGVSCKWQGSLEEVMPHLVMSHKSITTLQGEDIVFLATDINLPGAVDWVMMQSCFGHHFMLVLEKQEKYDGHQQFFAIAQLIGSRKQAENFAYRVADAHAVCGSGDLPYQAALAWANTWMGDCLAVHRRAANYRVGRHFFCAFHGERNGNLVKMWADRIGKVFTAVPLCPRGKAIYRALENE